VREDPLAALMMKKTEKRQRTATTNDGATAVAVSNVAHINDAAARYSHSYLMHVKFID
jgi:hypothetical protein